MLANSDMKTSRAAWYPVRHSHENAFTGLVRPVVEDGANKEQRCPLGFVWLRFEEVSYYKIEMDQGTQLPHNQDTAVLISWTCAGLFMIHSGCLPVYAAFLVTSVRATG